MSYGDLQVRIGSQPSPSLPGNALLLSLGPPSLVSLLGNGKLDTLAFWQRNPGLGALTNDENVGDTSGKRPVEHILDVDNIEASDMSLTVGDGADTSHVATTSDDDHVSSIKLDESGDLALLQVVLDGIVGFDVRVWVADSSSIVGDDVWNTTVANENLLDFAELVGSLLGGDAVNRKAALDIVKETEVLSGFFNGDHILEADGVLDVCSDLSIDLDESLGKDGSHLTTSKGVLETATEEDGKRKRFPELVRTRRRSRSIGAPELVEHPRTRRSKALQMLFGSTSHD